MIIQKQITENLIRTYSDQRYYIHGGYPEANYEEAIDPIDSNRVYIETDIPIQLQWIPENKENEQTRAIQILLGLTQ